MTNDQFSEELLTLVDCNNGMEYALQALVAERLDATCGNCDAAVRCSSCRCMSGCPRLGDTYHCLCNVALTPKQRTRANLLLDGGLNL
jgi:positive regulator of sigma E activity